MIDIVSVSMSCLIMWIATAAANINWTWSVRLVLSVFLALLINVISNFATLHTVDTIDAAVSVRLALTAVAMYSVGLPVMILLREKGSRLPISKAHYGALYFAVGSIVFAIVRNWSQIDWSN